MSEVRGIYAPRALHRQIRAAAREMVSVTRSHQNGDRALLAERDRLAAALEAAQMGLRYAVRVWVLSDEIKWSDAEIDEVAERIISDAKKEAGND